MKPEILTAGYSPCRCRHLICLIATVLVFIPAGASSAASEIVSLSMELPHRQNNEYERLLINALSELRHNRLDNALENIETLVRKNPRFKLAQLIYGDLLRARTQGITDFGGAPNASKNIILALREEARKRWQHHIDSPHSSQMPLNLLSVDRKYRHIVMVDLNASRLYIFRNDGEHPYLIEDYYISSGKKGAIKVKEGDKKTPLGVYYITSHIPAHKLPDFYGAGAYPINYPNEWDKRQGKTGYGIWLHGTPTDTYSRPPKASDGCVALTNTDFEKLSPFVKVGKTPVIIENNIEWLSINQWKKKKQILSSLLGQWEKDWESLNTRRYLSHYSKSFRGWKKDYKTWVQHKQRVNKHKSFIKLDLSNVNMFYYPGEKNTIVVDFHQKYKSDNYKQNADKRQFWRMEKDGRWRILYEGPA